jgi:hypothetical protein
MTARESVAYLLRAYQERVEELERALDQDNMTTITFRCLPKHKGVLPRPVPGVMGIPNWLRKMPSTVVSELEEGKTIPTVKQCAPFIDAMTCGFLVPLAVDVRIDDGEMSWDRAVLGSKPPIGLHEHMQVVGTPLFDRDRNIIKFNNFWAIETPTGYSLLVTHPINRHDLPFVTITGLVDTDSYSGHFINFAARWREPGFRGVLPRGTPIAQCIPVKRKDWTAKFETMSDDAMHELVDLSAAMAEEPGTYRRQFRARK